LVGSTVLVLGHAIPKPASEALELLVGLVLIWLAVDVIRRVRALHLHNHRHGDETNHLHVYSHAPNPADPLAVSCAPASGHQTEASPAGGMVHGLAGSAALVVITAQAITSPVVGVFYMMILSLGSIVGMSLVTPVHRAASAALTPSCAFRPEWLMLAAAATSLVGGTGIVLRAGSSLRPL
jgi:hypothetical protein